MKLSGHFHIAGRTTPEVTAHRISFRESLMGSRAFLNVLEDRKCFAPIENRIPILRLVIT